MQRLQVPVLDMLAYVAGPSPALAADVEAPLATDVEMASERQHVLEYGIGIIYVIIYNGTCERRGSRKK